VTNSKISFDTYVFDTLMRDLVGHDHSPSSFLVYVYIWMKASGRERNRVTLSYQALAEATGLSKSATQIAIRRLLRRQLLTAKKDGPTATPQYSLLRPWKRLAKLLAWA
jgi:DNA-binding MarR family transcriptional regulator